MATFEITGPDGKKYRVTGETAEGAHAALMKHLQGQQGEQAQQRPSYAQGLLDAFTDSAAFNFGDTLQGAEADLMGRDGEAEKQAFRERTAAFAEQNPTADTVARVAGGLATGAGLARGGLTLLRNAPSAASAFARGGLEGAAYGAAHGAGAADDQNVAESAMRGAAMGGLIGAPLAGGTQAIMNALARRSAVKAAPSIQDLRRDADAAYSTARAQNPQVPAFSDLAAQARPTLSEQGFLPRLHPKVSAALDEIEATAGAGVPDFKTVEKMRRVAKSAAGSLEPDERRLGSMLVQAIDDMVDRTAPVPEIKTGRELYGRMKRADLVEDATVRAIRRAATSGTGGNEVNAIRQNIRAILDNPKKLRGFSPDEIQAMEGVVSGTPGINAMRLVGRMSPTSGALPLMANIAAASVSPPALAVGALGMAAKGGAEAATRAQRDILSALIRSGQQIPQTSPMLPAGVRANLIRALAEQAGERSTAR